MQVRVVPIAPADEVPQLPAVAVLSQLTELSAVSLVSVTGVTSDGSVTADSDDNKQLNPRWGKWAWELSRAPSPFFHGRL